MSDREDYDSDAPEEFTAEQGIQQDEELSKVQKENKARVVREGKERRRQWAQRKTPKKTPQPSAGVESVQDAPETETHQESLGSAGMLPSNIIVTKSPHSMCRQVFHSDSEDENTDSKSTKKKKRLKSSGVDTVILKETPAPKCLQNSLAFLEKRKMQVSRSHAVLNNSNQALRFLSSSGLLSKNVTS
ncbi:hypothetical protein GBA52_023489 [Prunus armeniaca]|nr:hypothetical protein GBA52_023489 [Prunus armeniaca]